MFKMPTEIPIEKLTHILLILAVTFLVAKVAVRFVGMYAERKKDVLPSTSIFTNLVKGIIFALGALTIFQAMGISITPVLTALGVGGLAVALGLQETLSNLFSGVHILLSGQIRPGDYIRLTTGEEGHVADVTWRNTTIKTPLKSMIIIPNSKLASSIITNYYQPERSVLIAIPVGVSYDSDLEKVEKVTLEVAAEIVEGVKAKVLFQSFGDSAIQFKVYLQLKEVDDESLIRHNFIKKLFVRFKKEGIDTPHFIPLPK
ncbi:MAG: mechanosensitive ion channel family protein [Deltaproteobacteria bacterium]|nr:mechanosensitive ion channel family protein [Deltaproteobacteria bacterium]